MSQAVLVGYNGHMTKSKFPSVLITGASSGIGKALAVHLAGPGVHLAITGRNADRLAEVAGAASAKGAEVLAEPVDVMDRAAMREFIERADAERPLTLVIANAGISGGAGATSDDDEATRDIFAVNLAGVINTVLPAAHVMRKHASGRIAIVSSVAGYRGLPTAPAYSASKVAVKAWGDAIRPSLKEDGIGLTMIHPGFVESRITDANDFKMPFLMTAEKAAAIIAKGLAKGKREIAFPWQMVWSMRLLCLLPGPVFDAVMARAPRKI